MPLDCDSGSYILCIWIYCRENNWWNIERSEWCNCFDELFVLSEHFC